MSKVLLLEYEAAQQDNEAAAGLREEAYKYALMANGVVETNNHTSVTRLSHLVLKLTKAQCLSRQLSPASVRVRTTYEDKERKVCNSRTACAD